ncbi:choline-binding protein, partial [Ligilactobacillus agilis]
YYFDTVTGEMAKGQKHLGKYWYNFDANGKMSIGFTDIKDQHKTVYYDKDGRMLYGSQTIAGKKYYFNPFTGALKK